MKVRRPPDPAPNNVIPIGRLTRPIQPAAPQQQRTAKIIARVISLLRAGQWRQLPWLTGETAFIAASLSPVEENSLRQRYQHYQTRLRQGEVPPLPRFYFKGHGQIGAYFLNQVLQGTLNSEMIDVAGDAVRLRFVPAVADGLFPSQRQVAYEVALSPQLETQLTSALVPEEGNFGAPYTLVRYPQTITIPKSELAQTIAALVVSEEDGGNLVLAREKVKELKLDLPVITDREAMLEAELLYRARTIFDLPSLLEEGRIALTAFTLRVIDDKVLRFSPFWQTFLQQMEAGEIVGVSLGVHYAPDNFQQQAWGVIIEEEGQKKVLLLSRERLRKEETRFISLPPDFSSLRPPHYRSVHVFNLRRTNEKLDLGRVSEIGLAAALAEREPGAEI